MNTIQQAAQSAIDVQNACNLSGVAQSFAQAMLILRAQPACQGTKWANEHPIAVLYAVQIAFLTGVAVIADNRYNYNKCYSECEKLALQTDEQRQQEKAADDAAFSDYVAEKMTGALD